jgi:hypothetical protein
VKAAWQPAGFGAVPLADAQLVLPQSLVAELSQLHHSSLTSQRLSQGSASATQASSVLGSANGDGRGDNAASYGTPGSAVMGEATQEALDAAEAIWLVRWKSSGWLKTRIESRDMAYKPVVFFWRPAQDVLLAATVPSLKDNLVDWADGCAFVFCLGCLGQLLQTPAISVRFAFGTSAAHAWTVLLSRRPQQAKTTATAPFQLVTMAVVMRVVKCLGCSLVPHMSAFAALDMWRPWPVLTRC